MRKRFDRELWAKNDKLAKEKLHELFQNGLKRYTLVENEKKMGVDMLVYNKKGEHVFNVETEIKRVWKGKKFPYTNVQFPERKKKFASLEKPTLFVMFNEDQSAFLVVRDKDLINSPLEIVRNKYVSYGEQFYQVPLDKVSMNNLKSPVKTLEE